MHNGGVGLVNRRVNYVIWRIEAPGAQSSAPAEASEDGALMWKRASAALYGTRTSSSGRRFASPFAENGAGREQLNALYKVTNKVQRRRHFTRLRAPWRESRRQKARGLDLVYG
jgi:hypothetical protein